MSKQETELQQFLIKRAVSPEDTWHFAEYFEKERGKAADILFERLWWIIIAWGISYGIAKGIISEGSLDSFKIANLAPVLLVTPVLTAILYNDVAAAVLLEDVLSDLRTACIQHLYSPDNPPGAMSLTSNVFEAEPLLQQATGSSLRKALKFTFWPVVLLTGLGPLLITAHMSILLLYAPSPVLWQKLISVSIASTVSLRAVVTMTVVWKNA